MGNIVVKDRQSLLEPMPIEVSQIRDLSGTRDTDDVTVCLDGHAHVTFFLKITRKSKNSPRQASGYENHIEVFCRDFINDHCDYNEIFTKIKITLSKNSDVKNEIVYQSRSTGSYVRLSAQNPSYRFDNFPNKRARLAISKITLDSLVLLCELEPATSTMRGETSKLLDEAILADAMLVSGIDGSKHRCHKNFLAANSPVFKDLFEHDAEEKFVMDDLNGTTIRAMLEFVYKRSVRDIDAIGKELLQAANKYQMHHLANFCRDALLARIDAFNLGRIVDVAYSLDVVELKEACLDFFYENKEDMLDSETWKDLEKTQPRFGFDSLSRILRKGKKEKPKEDIEDDDNDDDIYYVDDSDD